ncbi:carboxymuconolactone decarboxylase family protein [Nitrincola sp. A-D6]|uniref:carboxymuconolactone decarboxylase family protein n=1 Tax=Nitrincola sp. A-D6 TaxID=1545442 RepID=UPI0005695265|nr:carboxymuconolactone decarboxylase family protein [Nitrincola sp. A-D6]
MSHLNSRETELVALGAALGSNCVPCIEYHIPQARKAGLTDQEIHDVILLADKVRQVPAKKVLETAKNLLPTEIATTETKAECC